MANLTLRIEPTEKTDEWTGLWFEDGRQLGDRIAVAGDDAFSLADLRKRFLGLFEGHRGRPMIEAEALRAMGRTLHRLWFEPAWPALWERIATDRTHRLAVQATEPEVLNLPWELVEVEGDRPVGCDAAWSLFRLPLEQARPAGGAVRGGPLRILFLASAPTNLAQLDHEREEDAILRATARLKDVGIYFAESGSYEDFKALVAECKPHVVHLSGHGDVKDGLGRFAFEDERGRMDLRGADQIVADVFRGDPHGVRCVFFNGCQTSQAATAGLCQSLIRAGVPLAVGWSASVIDDRAIDFAGEFYARLGRGEPAAVAAAHAREAIRRKGEPVGNDPYRDATFAIPQVYAPTADGVVYDQNAKREADPGPSMRFGPLAQGVKGLTHGFIGRRREQQKLVPAMRYGETTFAVLTGLGGTGKSTLATRVVNRLEAAGYQCVPVPAERDARGPGAAGTDLLNRMLKEIALRLLKAKRREDYDQLNEAGLPLEHRLALAVDALENLKLVLVIDDFEEVLDLETRSIVDEDLSDFYSELASKLVARDGSRVIVTCRYLPAQTPADQATVVHMPLAELPEAGFFKFLRRDEKVEARILAGELPFSLLRRLHQAFGGTPGFLEGIRPLLRTLNPQALESDLDGTAPGELSRAREKYYHEFITDRVYRALPPAARDVASRLAVSELPLPAAAVAGLVKDATADVPAALEAGVDFGLLQRLDDPDHPPLYHPPGLVRPWLADPARLPDEEAQEIHRSLAAFLKLAFDENRINGLRTTAEAGLAACRRHAELSDDRTIFRWATVHMARLLKQRFEWTTARSLLAEIQITEHDASSLNELAALEILLAEWASARSHLEEALRRSEDPAGVAAVWHNLGTIDMNEGSYTEAREKFGRALDVRQAIGDRAGQGATLHGLAMVDLKEGKYAEAREKYDRVEEITGAIGHWAGGAAALHNLASIDVDQGKYSEAREKFGRALDVRQAIGDRAGEAETLHGLASIDVMQDKHDEARKKFMRSLHITSAIGYRAGEAATWHGLASLDLKAGKYFKAREKFGRALDIRQAIGDRDGEATTWNNLAAIDMNEGKLAEAREKFGRALDVRQAIGDRDGEAGTLHGLATIDANEGKLAEAREKFGRALDVRQAIGDRHGVGETLHGLATIDANEGKYAEARAKFDQALLIKEEIENPTGVAEILRGLATIDMNEGKLAEAREKFGRALDVRQAVGDRDGEAETLHGLAMVDISEEKYAEARAKLDRTLLIKHQIGDQTGAAAALRSLATIDMHEGKHTEARAKLEQVLKKNHATCDRASEAEVLHSLATIDGQEGSYAEAQAKFCRALVILRAIDHRAGEAATLYQLGYIAAWIGRREEAARLIGMAFLIGQELGHGSATSSLREFLELCQSLGYEDKRKQAVLQEAEEEYRRDRGQSLIERAFAGLGAGDEGGGKGS